MNDDRDDVDENQEDSCEDEVNESLKQQKLSAKKNDTATKSASKKISSTMDEDDDSNKENVPPNAVDLHTEPDVEQEFLDCVKKVAHQIKEKNDQNRIDDSSDSDCMDIENNYMD